LSHDPEEWPDVIEEVEAHEPHPAEPAGLAELRRPERPADPLDEDRQFLRQMEILYQLGSHTFGVISLSDGVTNHVVNGGGIATEGRHYLVLYHETYAPEAGTFLQEGRNVAGVKARAYGEPGVWAVTQEEFFRVYDGAYHFDPGRDESNEAAEGQQA
jgi:hypothetical protein